MSVNQNINVVVVLHFCSQHTALNKLCFVYFPVIPFVIEGKDAPTPPNFGNTYHVKGKTCKEGQIKPFSSTHFCLVLRAVTFHFPGVISLPYAEIKEPFEAWFDLSAKSSRIDYYHGKNPPWEKRIDSASSLLRICDVKLRACCCKNFARAKYSLHNELRKLKRKQAYKTNMDSCYKTKFWLFCFLVETVFTEQKCPCSG